MIGRNPDRPMAVEWIRAGVRIDFYLPFDGVESRIFSIATLRAVMVHPCERRSVTDFPGLTPSPECWHRLLRSSGINEHHFQINILERIIVRPGSREGDFHHQVGLAPLEFRFGKNTLCADDECEPEGDEIDDIKRRRVFAFHQGSWSEVREGVPRRCRRRSDSRQPLNVRECHGGRGDGGLQFLCQ